MTKHLCSERVELLSYLDSLTPEETEEVGNAHKVLAKDSMRQSKFKEERFNAKIKRNQEEHEKQEKQREKDFEEELKKKRINAMQGFCKTYIENRYWGLHKSFKGELKELIEECDIYEQQGFL